MSIHGGRALALLRSTAAAATLTFLAPGNTLADDAGGVRSEDIVIDTPLARIGATMLRPGELAEGASAPCVVIAGGSLSQDRDGRLFREGVAHRDALKRLAEALASGGYSSVRYDRVGFGASKAKEGWKGTYAHEAKVLAAVIDHARKCRDVSGVVVAGESAGGYVACLAAKDGTQADAYIFLGAHCGPGREIYEYNFGRLVQHVEKFPENLAWAKDLRLELALGRHHGEMFRAAAEGKESFDLIDGDFRRQLDLARRREELESPPDVLFRHIKSPVLALAGEHDLNVAPEHAERIARVLREAGNGQVEVVLVPRADHSFQEASDSEHGRMRERFTLESFRRPYQPEAYVQAIRWLRATVPTPIEAHLDRVDAIARHTEASPEADEPAGTQVVSTPRTESSPRRLHLAPGIEVIEDITDAGTTAGVWTLEGRIGPLLLGEGSQAHFIDMPAGLHVEEHPHSSESIIYTARGRWVLCSRGRRQLMKEGSIFRFGAGVPTGYEVPFRENAFILIFKGDRFTKDEKEFIDYLKGMAAKLEKEQREGVPFRLADLPEEHPAREFARKVNPSFGQGPDPLGRFPEKVGAPSIENLLRVSERVLSGGQPQGEAAFRALAGMGVKTILSVDGTRPDVEAARKLGVRYVHIPIGYGGVSDRAGRALARVARDVEGLIYVHCHHGVHRGPAAAAIICLAGKAADTRKARGILELAGTGKQYPGLWKAVEEYKLPGEGETLPELREVAEVGSFAAAMAKMDRSFDNLKLLAEGGWKPLAEHPDLVPGREALLLKEGLQESVRHLGERDDRFKAWLDESLESVAALAEVLSAGRSEGAGEHFRQIQSLCARCHNEYRN